MFDVNEQKGDVTLKVVAFLCGWYRVFADMVFADIGSAITVKLTTLAV